VEDLALAWRIKQTGHRLRYLLGLGGNGPAALGAAALVALIFSGPWLLAPAAAITGLALPAVRPLLLAALVLAALGIALQLALRLWMRSQFALPLRHWWLMGAGGLVVAAIGPVSVWRTLTGRGWTWKGRPLG
jgi:hypothetical protein